MIQAVVIATLVLTACALPTAEVPGSIDVSRPTEVNKAGVEPPIAAHPDALSPPQQDVIASDGKSSVPFKLDAESTEGGREDLVEKYYSTPLARRGLLRQRH